MQKFSYLATKLRKSMAEDKKKKKKVVKQPACPLPDRLSESYIITTAHRNVGIYGERFIDVIDQATRLEEKDVEFLSGGITGLEKESDGSRTITFSFKRLMAHALDTNYDDAEEAMRKLESIFFEYRADGVWRSRALITDPEIDEVNHVGRIRIPQEIWEAVRDRKEGFRLFNPQVGLRVSSDYAYRLYKLVCGQKEPLTYMIADLKGMLGISDKYKRLADFLNRVIEPARASLLESADWYFDYQLSVSKAAQDKCKRGRPAYDKITFFAKVNGRNAEVSEMQALAQKYHQGNVARLLPDQLLNYLKNKYQFTEKEITNSHVIAEAYDLMKKNNEDLLGFLLDNTVRIDTAKNKKAYLVKMLKLHVAEKYGVVLGNPNNAVDTKAGRPRGGDVKSLSDLM